MYRGKRASGRNLERRMEAARIRRHAPLVARYHQVHALRSKGMAIAEIARHVGVARKTIYADLHLDHPPERKRLMRNPRERVLAPYESYLYTRWQQGCHNGPQLWREICERGYRHSRGSVARFVAALRRAGPSQTPSSGLTQERGPSARRVALLVVQRPEHRDEEETAYLTRLRAQGEMIELACRLGEEFAQMVRERGGIRLDGWIDEATASGIDDLTRFAAGLLTDEAAVRAGLTLVWSNAQVEGVRRVTQMWISPAGGWNWKGGFRVTRLTPRRKVTRTRAWRERGADAETSRVQVPQDPRPMARA